MPSIDELLAPQAELLRVATGATWSEGPCWIPQTQTLRWSDIHGNRILEYCPEAGTTSEYRQNAGYTNGRTLHPEGQVIQCSHGRRHVEIDAEGIVGPLVTRWAEGRFNSPNDVIVARDHSVWFTDPHYGITVPGEGHLGEMEYGGCYIFRWDPSTETAHPVITEIPEPNGLAFSPDESTLYVADSSAVRREPGVGNHHVVAYAVDWTEPEPTCHGGTVLFEIAEGVPDGIRVDREGRIWSSAADGVHVFSAAGEPLGHLPVPEVVGNLCFGGPHGNDLYIAATTSIYHIQTTVQDAAWKDHWSRP